MSAEVDARCAKAALEHWEIGALESIARVVSSTESVYRVRTRSGADFVLKRKPELERALREARLLAWLAERSSLPVAPLLAATGGSAVVEHEGSRFTLHARLRGEPLAPLQGAAGQAGAHALGRAIQALHGALRECPSEAFPVQKLAAQLRDWAIPTVLRHRDLLRTDALVAIAEGTASLLDLLEPELPAHLIHRDAHPGNFLFEAGELTGILDFDQALHGARIFDICYRVSAMLAGGFDDPERRDAWPSRARGVIDGYASRSPLLPAELEAVPAVLEAIQLIFIAWGIESRLHGVALLNQEVLLWQQSQRAKIERLHDD